MTIEKRETDLAVIGAGPGGYAAAFRAADLGMRVALIDVEKNPGGVCLFRGCIPSKAFLHVAKVIAEAKQASSWGVEFASPRIDSKKLTAWKEGVAKKLTEGLGQLSRQRKIEFIEGRGDFLDSNTLRILKVGKGEIRLSFKQAILATGSRPFIPEKWPLESPGLLNSTSALQIDSIPKTLLVVGGGYIGLELGTVYAELGTKVSVVEMTSGYLPGVDRDLVTPLAKRLEKLFVRSMFETEVVGISEKGGGLAVKMKNASGEQEEIFDKVLVAIGRRPNSSGLGLDNTKVEVDEKGFVKVDPQRRTSDSAIFAIGDLAGEPMLAHKASHEARVAVEVIHGENAAFEPMAIPAVVFTDPEIAWCGLTENEAREKGIEIAVARFPWAASGRALTLDRPEGVTKLILDPKTEQILGVGICGSGAGELISEGVLAVEMGTTASDLKLSIHPHPTLSETLMEASEVFFGQSVHLYRPKREVKK